MEEWYFLKCMPWKTAFAKSKSWQDAHLDLDIYFVWEVDFSVHETKTGYGVKTVHKNREFRLTSCSVRTGERQLPVSCFLCPQPDIYVLFNIFSPMSHICYLERSLNRKHAETVQRKWAVSVPGVRGRFTQSDGDSNNGGSSPKCTLHPPK